MDNSNSTETDPTRTANLHTSPAATVALVIFQAACVEFQKPKQRRRLERALADACVRIESREGVLRIRDREPHAQAQARVDAAAALRILLNSKGESGPHHV